MRDWIENLPIWLKIYVGVGYLIYTELIRPYWAVWAAVAAMNILSAIV
jgi:hypothetical protein